MRDKYFTFLVVSHHTRPPVLAPAEEVLAGPEPEARLATALVVDAPDGLPLAGHHLQVGTEGGRPGPAPLPGAGLAGPGGRQGDQHRGLARPETTHAD